MSNIYPFCPLLCGIRTNFILEHIKKCKNKALLGSKYFQCPYNPKHIFGKKVFQMHVDRCPDRFKKKNKKQEDKLKLEEEKKEEDKEVIEKEENKEVIEKEEEKEEIKKEEKKEEIENHEKNNRKNLFIEEDEIDDEKEGFIRSHKRHYTSINLDRYSHNKTLKILLSRPDDKNQRKQSENIINQLYVKERLTEKQKEKKSEEELNLIKKKKEEEELKKKISLIKKNSSSDLGFKGVLKHKTETEPQLRKTNSLHKITFNLSYDKEKEKSIDESLNHFNETDSENSEEISPRLNTDYQRKKKRSVIFKGFVKVFVFDGKKKKRRILQRSAFINTKLYKEPENQNDQITDIYMKSL